MSAVRLCGNAQSPNVQNVPQLTWILAQSAEKSIRYEIKFFDVRKVVKKSGDYAESAISKDCRFITPTPKNIPQTSEVLAGNIKR